MKKITVLLSFVMLFFGQIRAQNSPKNKRVQNNPFEKIDFGNEGWHIKQCLVRNPPCERWRGDIPVKLPKFDKCQIALNCPGCEYALCAGNLRIKDVPDFEISLQLFDAKSQTYKDLVKGTPSGKDKILVIDKNYKPENLSFLVVAKNPLKEDRTLVVEYVK
jgi:hypothetical protein